MQGPASTGVGDRLGSPSGAAGFYNWHLAKLLDTLAFKNPEFRVSNSLVFLEIHPE